MTTQTSEIIRLNIIEKYDVNWSLDFIIRDFVQNYYDSLIDHPQYSFCHDIQITIDDVQHSGCISGPVQFDWEDLKYLGATTKEDKDKYAGGFGEGFLIACLCLLKLSPKVDISIAIGKTELPSSSLWCLPVKVFGITPHNQRFRDLILPILIKIILV